MLRLSNTRPKSELAAKSALLTVTNRFLLDGQRLGNCELKKVGNSESPKFELPTSTNMFSLIPHVAEPFHACVIPSKTCKMGCPVLCIFG